MKLNIPGEHTAVVELGDNTQVLFSYKTPVAAYKDGKFYRTDCRWSKTTTRHINQWLDGREAVSVPQEFFRTLTAN